jgi:hypothetical protein
MRTQSEICVVRRGALICSHVGSMALVFGVYRRHQLWCAGSSREMSPSELLCAPDGSYFQDSCPGQQIPDFSKFPVVHSDCLTYLHRLEAVHDEGQFLLLNCHRDPKSRYGSLPVIPTCYNCSTAFSGLLRLDAIVPDLSWNERRRKTAELLIHSTRRGLDTLTFRMGELETWKRVKRVKMKRKPFTIPVTTA